MKQALIPGAGRTRPNGAPRLPDGVVAAAWIGLVAGGFVIGLVLNLQGRHIALGAPPLVGDFAIRVGPAVLLPLAVGAAGVWAGPRLAGEIPWPWLLVATGLAAMAWALSLGLVDGIGGLTDSLRNHNEYLADLPSVGSLGPFVATFVDRIDSFGTHVRAHPPGLIVSLALLDRAGLGGAAPAAALMVAAGGSAVSAVLVAVREVAGEARARAAAPYLVLAPAAVWVATSADALFAGAGAWAVALIVLATGRRGRTADTLALVGGGLFGLALFLTYGVVLLAAVPLAVGLARRRMRPLLVATLGMATVLSVPGLAGFWWPSGLLATRQEYADSVAQYRPYWAFLWINLAAFAVAVGPATIAAVARLRDRGVRLLAGGGLAAVTVAALSGLSKGEVERIWLPFAMWTLAATAAFASDPRAGRRWLAANGAVALVVQVGVRTAW